MALAGVVNVYVHGLGRDPSHPPRSLHPCQGGQRIPFPVPSTCKSPQHHPSAQENGDPSTGESRILGG
jgi:hypothetical protein